MNHQLSLFIILFCFGISAGHTVETNAATENLSRGWKLILKQNLTIPAYEAGVYLQYGKIVSVQERDQYYSNCRLEVRDPQEHPQVVEADSFTVYRVKRSEEDASLYTPQYASTVLSMASPTADDYITTLYLRSKQQPDVIKLECRHWEDPSVFPEHLSLKQIRDTLGEIFTLASSK